MGKTLPLCPAPVPSDESPFGDDPSRAEPMHPPISTRVRPPPYHDLSQIFTKLFPMNDGCDVICCAKGLHAHDDSYFNLISILNVFSRPLSGKINLVNKLEENVSEFKLRSSRIYVIVCFYCTFQSRWRPPCGKRMFRIF